MQNHSQQTTERCTQTVDDTAMSYVQAGVGKPIVCLHGNPTSSYLWRNIIPYISSHGRCIAPDLIGMGHSGPAPSGNYHFRDHSRYLDAWFDAVIGREPVILVLHDWGSALGFYWAHRHPEQIRGIAYMEAIVQPRSWSDFPAGRVDMFRRLRSPEGDRLIIDENFFIEKVLPASIIRQLTDAEMECYRAPFREPTSRRPLLQWPRELPIEGEPTDVVELVERYGAWLAESNFPKLFVNADPGALLIGRAREFCRSWPNQQEVTVRGIHFLQEDSPHEIGTAIRDFVAQIS